MSVLTDPYSRLDSNLVFISDGAKWIKNWIDTEYPQATQILDYWHAKEHLSVFCKEYFSDSVERTAFIEKVADILLEKDPGQAMETIQKLPRRGKRIEKEKNRLLQYYKENQDRMQYQGYLKRGLIIGSGAVEAAHRTVVQKRLKLSGQRWSSSGAQNVMNLRVLKMSGHWHVLKEYLATG